MLKKIFIILIILVASVFWVDKSQAGAGDNVSGWAWSNMDDPSTTADERTIGWISFNSTNCDSDGNGRTDTANYSQCPVNATSTNYGVSINQSSGVFSGYAWSENIGWIHFAPAGPYPASPNYFACLDKPGSGQTCDGTGNYKVSGWARALSYGGGWDGWIKLRGTNYGVDISRTTGDFSGYAWGSDVVGWINFSGATYKVKTTFAFNSPPNKPNVGSPAETWANCSFVGKSTPTFNWTYSDQDGDPQSAYEIEVDDNSSFSAPKFNHLVSVAATTTSYGLDLTQDDSPQDWISALVWDTNYFWRIRVKDNQGNWSQWSNSNGFRTPEHAYPYPDFTFLPAQPAQGEQIDFNPDNSQVFGGATIQTYLWTITQGTGSFLDSNQNSRYPHIKFSTLNNKLKLQITDSDGYSCGFTSAEKDITVQLPLPEYKEIPPIFWAKKILASLVDFFNKF